MASSNIIIEHSIIKVNDDVKIIAVAKQGPRGVAGPPGSGGGAGTWGTITGNLADQTDLLAALNAKESSIASGSTTQYFRGDKSWQTLDKASVGLSNVNNTSDLDKAISTATQTALNGKEPSIASGSTTQYFRGDKSWQTLDKASVGLSNLNNTSDVDKPISTATQTALNAKEASITSGSTTEYFRGDKSWQTLDKASVGLSNVNNTSDLDKTISTATQTALNLKANLASPIFSGQVGIGGTPGATAALDIQSTTGSLIIPRMSNAQMYALSAATNGQLVYNNESQTIWGTGLGFGFGWQALFSPFTKYQYFERTRFELQEEGRYGTNKLIVSGFPELNHDATIYMPSETGVISNTIFTNDTSKVVVNTSTETSLIPTTGIGSMTVVANAARVGKKYRVQLYGSYQTPTTPDNVTIKIKLGSTVIASVVVSSSLLTANSTLNEFYAEAILTFFAKGASGTVVSNGFLEFKTASDVVKVPFSTAVTSGTATSLVTINTTAALLVDITGTWAAAQSGQGITIMQASLEALN